MRSFFPFVAWGIAALALTVNPARAAQLSLTADGVVIETVTDKYVLQKPVLNKKGGGTVPSTVTLSDDGKSLIEKFTDGPTVTISIQDDGKTIEYKCSDPVDNYQGFAVNMSFPVSFANGGQYAYDADKLANLPAEVGKVDNVARGDHEIFHLVSPSGNGITLKMPKSWNKLQDNRFYNNGTTFEEQYLYIFATYQGNASFTIMVEDLAPPSPTPTPTP